MNKVPLFLLLSLLGISCYGQNQLTDMKTLIGKKVIVQRMPFFQPGTYTPISNSYAGQTAQIIEIKPSAVYASMPKLTAKQMASLPPESRINIENVRSACTIVIKFSDGTIADTGAIPVMSNTLASYLDVLQEEASAPALGGTLPPKASTGTKPDTTLPNGDCPLVITKATSSNGGFGHALADALTKSEFEMAVERASAGGKDPHYLDVRMRNESGKKVRAIEAFVTYADAMGDSGPEIKLLSQNPKDIDPRGEYRGYSVDTEQRSENGIGDVTVFLSRVRYEDNSFWRDNGSHSCALTTRIK